MKFLADTTLLIDLQRELNKAEGLAMLFMQAHAEDSFSISFVSVGEFACVISYQEEIRAKQFLDSFIVIESSNAISWRFGKEFQNLKQKRLTVGANDLWIAATCLELGMPLVTRNRKDFENITGLEVISY